MKKPLRNVSLTALAFILAPLAQANADTVFDSSVNAWTGQSSFSTPGAGGSSTLGLPASTDPNGSAGADYFTLPTAITTGSGVWTFSTTATFNIPVPPATANNNGINIGVGFGNFTSTNWVMNSSGVASANGTGGPFIQDVRDPFNPLVSFFAGLNSGSGSTGSVTSAISQGNSPENGNQGTPLQLKLVLDTTGAHWTVSEYVDGILAETFTYQTDPTITGIGISAFGRNLDDTSVTFSNTTLTDDVTSAVPEASTWAMMMLGFAGLGLVSYRRTRRNGGLNVRLA